LRLPRLLRYWKKCFSQVLGSACGAANRVGMSRPQVRPSGRRIARKPFAQYLRLWRNVKFLFSRLSRPAPLVRSFVAGGGLVRLLKGETPPVPPDRLIQPPGVGRNNHPSQLRALPTQRGAPISSRGAPLLGLQHATTAKAVAIDSGILPLATLVPNLRDDCWPRGPWHPRCLPAFRPGRLHKRRSGLFLTPQQN
jgi:hypothetical protein